MQQILQLCLTNAQKYYLKEALSLRSYLYYLQKPNYLRKSDLQPRLELTCYSLGFLNPEIKIEEVKTSQA